MFWPEPWNLQFVGKNNTIIRKGLWSLAARWCFRLVANFVVRDILHRRMRILREWKCREMCTCTVTHNFMIGFGRVSFPHTYTHIYIYNGFAQIGSSQNHILSFPGKLYKSIHFFGYIRFSTVPHVKTCKAKQNVLAGVLDFSAHSKNQQSLERTMERWNHFFLVGAICPNSPHLLLSLVEEVPRIRSPPFALWFLRGGKAVYIYI